MRHLITASAIVIVGIAAAIPFRRQESEKSSPSAQIASGPLGNQLSPDATLNVSQWIDRSEADPAIAWQSQPMSFERDAHALELPEMPPEFSFDEVDKAIPQPIQSRFSASANASAERKPSVESDAERFHLQAPPLASEPIDRLPAAVQSRTHELAVQGVSTVPSVAQSSLPQTTVMRPPLMNASVPAHQH